METYCSATGVARSAREFLTKSTEPSLLRSIPAENITSKDVYDAAEWSCITELSELSVRQGSIPVEIPDFTRGNWEGDK